LEGLRFGGIVVFNVAEGSAYQGRLEHGRNYSEIDALWSIALFALLSCKFYVSGGPWERCGFGESVQLGSLVFLGLKALNSKRGQGLRTVT
jgi:hypothetical protein